MSNLFNIIYLPFLSAVPFVYQMRGVNSVSSPSYSESVRDVVHNAFYVTTATHGSGGRKGRDQPHVYFTVGLRWINQYTLIK